MKTIMMALAAGAMALNGCGGGGSGGESASATALSDPVPPGIPLQQPGDGFSPFMIAVADFNGDGFPDLALGRSSGTAIVSIFLAVSSGTYPAAPNFEISLDSAAMAGTVADFNGDGKADLVVGTGSGTLLFIGHGDGTFGSASDVYPDFEARDLVKGDFDGDGRPDLAISSSDQIVILVGNGDGTFVYAQTLFFGAYLRAADFDLDGRDEIAVIENRHDHYINVYSRIAIDPQIFTSLPLAPNQFATDLVVTDIDKDGILDILASSYDMTTPQSGAIRIYRGWGDGSFDFSADIATDSVPTHIAVGDFDGDGLNDLASSSSGTIKIAWGSADGSFAWGAETGTFGAPGILVAAELTGDANSDLVVGADGFYLLVGSRTMLAN